MHTAARSYLATGVALVGAGAIAISPVAPPLPDAARAATSSVTTSDLQLSALANPFVVYGEVVENTLTNLGLLGERVLADPAPILAQILQNQWNSAQTLGGALDRAGESLANSFSVDNPFGVPALLRAAGDHLAAGDLEGAINSLWQVVITPLLGPAIELIPAITSVIRQPVQNMLNVIDQTQLPITLFAIGVLSPIYAGFVKAGGAFVQDVFDAARTGDLEGLANAFITGPAAVINGFLNGDAVDAGFFSPGLGTISGLLNIRDAIAQALRPVQTAGIAAIDSTTTDAATQTVSVSVESSEQPGTSETALAQEESTKSEGVSEPADATAETDPLDDTLVDDAPVEEAPVEDDVTDVTDVIDDEESLTDDEEASPAQDESENASEEAGDADAGAGADEPGSGDAPSADSEATE